MLVGQGTQCCLPVQHHNGSPLLGNTCMKGFPFGEHLYLRTLLVLCWGGHLYGVGVTLLDGDTRKWAIYWRTPEGPPWIVVHYRWSREYLPLVWGILKQLFCLCVLACAVLFAIGSHPSSKLCLHAHPNLLAMQS